MYIIIHVRIVLHEAKGMAWGLKVGTTVAEDSSSIHVPMSGVSQPLGTSSSGALDTLQGHVYSCAHTYI